MTPMGNQSPSNKRYKSGERLMADKIGGNISIIHHCSCVPGPERLTSATGNCPARASMVVLGKPLLVSGAFSEKCGEMCVSHNFVHAVHGVDRKRAQKGVSWFEY